MGTHLGANVRIVSIHDAQTAPIELALHVQGVTAEELSSDGGAAAAAAAAGAARQLEVREDDVKVVGSPRARDGGQSTALTLRLVAPPERPAGAGEAEYIAAVSMCVAVGMGNQLGRQEEVTNTDVLLLDYDESDIR